MLPVKFLFVLSLQVLAVFGLGNIVLMNLPELDEEKLKWPQQKIETIEYLLDTLIEVGNVTLIGWQHIWNSDGTLKEIRTIELTLLNRTLFEEMPYLSSDYLTSELPGILDVADTIFSATGILVSGSVKEWYGYANPSSKPIQFLEINPSSIMKKPDDLMFWQQNITVNNQTPINNLIKVLQQDSRLPVGILQWNVDGTLNFESSVIVPELLATITHMTPANANASLPILESALTAVVKGMLLQPDGIIAYVANYMKQNVPGYTWMAGTNLMSASSISGSVFLEIAYKLVDIGHSSINLNIGGIPIQTL